MTHKDKLEVAKMSSYQGKSSVESGDAYYYYYEETSEDTKAHSEEAKEETSTDSSAKEIDQKHWHDRQALVDEYFINLVAPNPSNDTNVNQFESSVIHCDDGDKEWNATCAFANIYHMADSSAPTAFVVKDSLQAKSFETLPKLTYYGTYKGNDPLQIKTFASIDELVSAAKDTTQLNNPLVAGRCRAYPRMIWSDLLLTTSHTTCSLLHILATQYRARNV